MQFQSTPSAGRATGLTLGFLLLEMISIHALRGEGDGGLFLISGGLSLFQSTPSAGRATEAFHKAARCGNISIHALRGEGDR